MAGDLQMHCGIGPAAPRPGAALGVSRPPPPLQVAILAGGQRRVPIFGGWPSQVGRGFWYGCARVRDYECAVRTALVRVRTKATMVDFSFIVSLYVSDLLNVTNSTKATRRYDSHEYEYEYDCRGSRTACAARIWALLE